MTINPDRIPADLKIAPRWVCWKRIARDGKPTKVPYQANGRPAKSDDPATWSTFAACAAALPKFDGIGIMLGDGLAGIDLDHCIDDAGNLTPLARQVLDLANSYTEITPSEHGLHIVFYCAGLPTGGRRKGAFEYYDTRRYLTVTGNHYAGTPAEVRFFDDDTLCLLYTSDAADE